MKEVVRTARYLINAPQPSEGYTKLFELIVWISLLRPRSLRTKDGILFLVTTSSVRLANVYWNTVTYLGGSRFPFLNVNTWLSRTTMPNGLVRKIATHTAGMVPLLKIPPKRS